MTRMTVTPTCSRHAWAGLQPLIHGFRGSVGTRLLHALLLAAGASLCICGTVFAETPDSRTTEGANKSWTIVTDLKRDNVVPARIIESHSQNGNRILDKRSLQIARSAGHFEFYEDTETETLWVDASTVRITTRTFAQDGTGRRTLVDVTEESKHALPNGNSNTTRITSHSDLNGSLQVIKREIVETKSVGNDTEETNTTVLLSSINGGFAPAVKTQEIRKRGANDTIQSQTTLLRDGAGNWQTREIRQNTTSQEAGKLSSEERILRRNAEGKLVEISRRLRTDSSSASGEEQTIVESYSLYLPGSAPDGALHLVERTTGTRRTGRAGEQTMQERVEQTTPGDPQSGLRLSVLINETMRPGPSGLEATRMIRMRDANGSFGVVEVDTTKSDKLPTIHIPNAFGEAK